MISCAHEPKIQPGIKCDCQVCRTARSVALMSIMTQCYQCCGRMATDHNGQLTCAKQQYDCPILDLWHSVLNREIDPAKVTPVMAEVVFKGLKDVPRRYPRVSGALSWTATSIRDFSLAGPMPEVAQSTGGPVLPAVENVPGVPAPVTEAPAPQVRSRQRAHRKEV